MTAKEFVEKITEAGIIGMPIDNIVFDYISQDEKIIPALLALLASERSRKHQLLLDTNSELSMALVTLDSFSSDEEQRKSTIQQIKAHYHRVADQIKCCFRVSGIPE